MKILRSMTGFGRFVQNNDKYALVWEIRSVNGRFLDIKWKLPALLRSFESHFEKIVRQYAARGRVEISLTLQEVNQERLVSQKKIFFDTVQAHAMLAELAKLAAERGETYQVDYNSLLKIPALWIGNEEEASEELVQSAKESLAAALQDWNVSREEEAKTLKADLTARFAKMREWLNQINAKAPEVKESRFQVVRERVQEVLQRMDVTFDESRFLQEIVLIADKLDISEECTRLDAHIKRLFELMDNAEDAGRKLDFTLQESFREINTCGNKVQDSVVSVIVVDYKNELEKCREQVQNLE